MKSTFVGACLISVVIGCGPSKDPNDISGTWKSKNTVLILDQDHKWHTAGIAGTSGTWLQSGTTVTLTELIFMGKDRQYYLDMAKKDPLTETQSLSLIDKDFAPIELKLTSDGGVLADKSGKLGGDLKRESD